MPLSSDLLQNSKQLRSRAHELSAFLNELETRLPKDEDTRRAFTNARATVGFIHSQCTQIETTLGAARMVGEIEGDTKAGDLELHPANQGRDSVRPYPLPPQVEHDKLLESLHRAGDHSLDPDERRDG